jgi:hypothetical protein
MTYPDDYDTSAGKPVAAGGIFIGAALVAFWLIFFALIFSASTR